MDAPAFQQSKAMLGALATALSRHVSWVPNLQPILLILSCPAFIEARAYFTLYGADTSPEPRLWSSRASVTSR